MFQDVRGNQAQRYALIFLWTCLGFFYVSLISQWITLSTRDKMFTESTNHLMQAASTRKLSANEVRALLLIKAEDLSLPVHRGDFNISGTAQTLRATVRYQEDISMPIVNQPVYRMRFTHDFKLKPPQ